MWGLVAGIGASLLGARSQQKAVNQAAQAQQATTQASIDEQRRQFDHLQGLLKPYVDTGATAFAEQSNLMGLNGIEAQQTAIDNLNASPFLQSAYRQAENALLQNASATGGLRGGNMQSALADNRMNMLHQAYQGKLQNLGSMASIGQNAAAGVGNAGANFANSVSNLNQAMGQSLAGQAIANGKAKAGMWNSLGGLGLFGFGQKQGWF